MLHFHQVGMFRKREMKFACKFNVHKRFEVKRTLGIKYIIMHCQYFNADSSKRLCLHLATLAPLIVLAEPLFLNT